MASRFRSGREVGKNGNRFVVTAEHGRVRLAPRPRHRSPPRRVSLVPATSDSIRDRRDAVTRRTRNEEDIFAAVAASRRAEPFLNTHPRQSFDFRGFIHAAISANHPRS